MRNATYPAAALALTLAAGPAAAQSPEEKLREIDWSGLLEIEAGYEDPREGAAASDLAVATAELGATAQLQERTQATVVLLHEDGSDEEIEVDQAHIQMRDASGTWGLRAGRLYLPWGDYTTYTVSDPLTLALGETRETAVEGTFRRGGLTARAYAYNGELQPDGEDRIDSAGASLAYRVPVGGATLTAQAGYTSSLGDADELQAAIQDATDDSIVDETVGAWDASLRLEGDRLSLIGEYMAAVEAFPAASLGVSEAPRPRAGSLEAAWHTQAWQRKATLAVGYQGTEEATEAFGLPEERLVAAASVLLRPATRLSLEWRSDDYAEADGDAVTAQLALTF
ncbi:LbtU family siderophore porin [Halorhodospira neutriphila]|uniref:LbtU family siderophore porin n=1 Tax=Halorhodospira neutriphila TaxID=168379 RepID=A0ABS1E8K7_9GAMM|nr:LbtU family siderophore porin [Halorhodospira neutriphila]MBK1727030.1 hypothetical protein [Halorhodospira neutriphila]